MCPNCDNTRTISFNVQYAREGIDATLQRLLSDLRRVRELKFGVLFWCSICGLEWVLDTRFSMMERVPQHRKELLQEWDSKTLLPSETQKNTLMEIGGNCQGTLEKHEHLVSVPCAITKESGDVLDPAVVIISQHAPLLEGLERVILFEHIHSVHPSPYSLSVDLRNATFAATEIRMGFAPTRAESIGGAQFVLDWGQQLFDRDGVKGSEIRFAKSEFNFPDPRHHIRNEPDNITYVQADWFDGAEQFIQQSAD